ncbi:MAG: type II toxin-antitoxin system RelE/ParE family toxin [Thermodesulfobacteriota bacterium]
MRVFKNKWFARWMRRENILDSVLLQAAAEVVAGRVEADLGGGIFK